MLLSLALGGHEGIICCITVHQPRCGAFLQCQLQEGLRAFSDLGTKGVCGSWRVTSPQVASHSTSFSQRSPAGEQDTGEELTAVI